MYKSLGIKHYFLLLALLPAIGISIFFSVYSNFTHMKDLNESMFIMGKATVTKLASQGKYGILTGDEDLLKKIALKELGYEILGVGFYNSEGSIITSAGKIPHYIQVPEINTNTSNAITEELDYVISFTIPISIVDVVVDDYSQQAFANNNYTSSKIIGWSKVIISKNPTKIKAFQFFFNSSFIAIIAIAISSIFAVRLGRKITNPILKLNKSLEKIKRGDFSKVNTNAKWELVILEEGINEMAAALQNIHQEMQTNIDTATSELTTSLKTVKEQNLALELSRKEEQQANQVKTKFLENMSHELITPLNGIIGFLNLLQETKLNKLQQEYVDTILKSSTNLLTIINNILDFSKMESGELQLSLEPVMIRECIEDAVTLLAPSSHDKNLELIPVIYSDVPKKILGDSLRIKQVITNLVSNAIKFTEKGDVIIRVILEREEIDEVTLCISISDNGIGLSKEQSEKIQLALQQQEISKSFSDIGLGLTICKNLVTQMNGNLILQNPTAKGSTFSFTLTTKKLQVSAIDELQQLPSIRVLLFDANVITRAAIFNLLSSWGLRVTELDSYDKIEPTIKKEFQAKEPFQVVIIGCKNQENEPSVSNKILQMIKSTYLCPIIILTNTTKHNEHNSLIAMGANICLAKPICHAKLYNALCKLFMIKNKNNFITKEIPELEVLVVDDNAANVKLASALLKNIGVNVTIAYNGKQALAITQEKLFNIIFMDILMPDIDGIKVSSQIREKDNLNKDTIIIAISAHVLLTDKQLLKTAGINDYLTKPINESQLRAYIYKWTQYENIQNYKSLENNIEKLVKDLPSFDWKLSLQLATGNEQLAKDLLNLLLSSLNKDQELINKHHQQRDFKSLREIVHRLHGSCCYTGVSKLKYICKNLEQAVILKDTHKTNSYIKLLNTEIKYLLANVQQPA